MNKADQILANILNWATQETNIRAVLLTGSRARLEPYDELADFDIAIFCNEAVTWLQDDSWFDQIAPVWVWIPESYRYGKHTIPTRLIIFDEGIKVDFSFFPLPLLTKVNQNAPFKTGYKILLDKDKLGQEWKPAKRANQTPAKPPSEADFVAVVNEFWFESYHVAKYLKREELWQAKFRDWTTKELLLKVIEWHAQVKRPSQPTYYLGKHMQEWVEPDVWNVLHGAFAYFDSVDSWQALYTSTWLFRRLAKEIAQLWEFNYPETADKTITEFINSLQEQANANEYDG